MEALQFHLQQYNFHEYNVLDKITVSTIALTNQAYSMGIHVNVIVNQDYMQYSQNIFVIMKKHFIRMISHKQYVTSFHQAFNCFLKLSKAINSELVIILPFWHFLMGIHQRLIDSPWHKVSDADNISTTWHHHNAGSIFDINPCKTDNLQGDLSKIELAESSEKTVVC